MTATERLSPIEVLLVEDDPGDVLMTREAFEEHKVNNRLTVVSDGAEALAAITLAEMAEPQPALVRIGRGRALTQEAS